MHSINQYKIPKLPYKVTVIEFIIENKDVDKM